MIKTSFVNNEINLHAKYVGSSNVMSVIKWDRLDIKENIYKIKQLVRDYSKSMRNHEDIASNSKGDADGNTRVIIFGGD